MLKIPLRREIDTEFSLPGSKSITNRALVIGALADGETQLSNWLRCEDTTVMIQCLRELGFSIVTSDAGLKIKGRAGSIARDRAVLQTDNSGTTMRFLTGLVSLGRGIYTLDGSPRMRQRPIGDLLDGLRQLGVAVAAERENGCPPVIVRAAGLDGGSCELSGEISSQFLSALLLVAPYAFREVTIRVRGELVSRPYVDMTLRMMEDFGVAVAEAAPSVFTILPGVYRGREYAVEGDASSASYFLAAAALTGGRMKIRNVGENSIQGDSGFGSLLGRMGARVRTGPEWTEVSGPLVRSIEADLNAMPDMVPTLAVAALFVPGRTVIANVGNLRFKESDRLRAVATELRRIGGQVEELPDGLVIEGGELHGAEIETYNDHRIAMAFALAGLRIPGIKIKDPACVAKTFPGFFDAFLRL